MSNVVILDSIGGEFTALNRAISPLNNKINDNARPSYVAAGAQKLLAAYGYTPSLLEMRLIDANKTGAQEVVKTMYTVNSAYGGQDVDVIFFQAR